MKNGKPLKRAKELQPYSKDHHHGLLLGWKIRTGLKKEVAIERICAYVAWFYNNHLIPHFELEEQYIFPLLGLEHDLIRKACNDHHEMRSLMASGCDRAKLMRLTSLLEAHIRFEEREVFEQIQVVATKAQLAVIDEVHNDERFTEYFDEFWK
jgi:hypothetical protein